MACRHAFPRVSVAEAPVDPPSPRIAKPIVPKETTRLLFGVDSSRPASELLQNNLKLFEWVVRNKIFPCFWGRDLNGDTPLTSEEVRFLHRQGCKIAATVVATGAQETDEQGVLIAKQAADKAQALGIPEGCAIFLVLEEEKSVDRDFLRGFAGELLKKGFTPGFQMNTDARFMFDREFSRGMQTNKAIFENCLVWATAPAVSEYDNITTSHLIHPDEWIPYAPSGITRKEIALWRYGNKCHPIENDGGKTVTFNMNLVRNEQVITDKMF